MIWTTAQLRGLEVSVAEAEVVYAFVSLAGKPAGDDEALLDEDERRRAARFRRPADRDRFTLAHAALRLFLSRCVGVAPGSVTYELGGHGKPHLAQGLPPLEFNLSHADELCLLAAARERPVGVDLEHIRDLPDAPAIAAAHFAEAEKEGLRSLPPDERLAAFFRVWTRKEAVLKADGEGLGGRSLDSFQVGFEPGPRHALQRGNGLSLETDWHVQDLPAPPGFAAAGVVAAAPGVTTRWRRLRAPLQPPHR